MTRHRRRGGGRATAALAVLLAALLIVAPLPAVSFSTGSVGRGAGIGVAADEDALVALNVSPSLSANATNCLVVVTNNHDRTITATVSLDGGSRDDADLLVPTGGTGDVDSVTVDVSAGASQRVEASVGSNASGTKVIFDTSATTDDSTMELPGRSSPVTDTGDPTSCT